MNIYDRWKFPIPRKGLHAREWRVYEFEQEVTIQLAKTFLTAEILQEIWDATTHGPLSIDAAITDWALIGQYAGSR